MKKNIQKMILALLLSVLLLFMVSCSSGGRDSNEGETTQISDNETTQISDSEAKATGDNVATTISDNDAPITFSDSVFEHLLQAELGKDEIYSSDLDIYTGVKIISDQFVFLSGPDHPEKSIILLRDDTFEYEEQQYTGLGSMTTLDDLKYFSNLKTLKVYLQPGIDFTTIPNIERFVQFDFTNNKISDIGFLADATGLIYLNLGSNEIADINSLANCTKITSLSCDYNDISDINVLKNLTALKYISFYDNDISDISVFSNLVELEEIGMYKNNISDISVLAGLPNLTYVELIDNQITDVSPLKDFTSFQRLALSGNPVENIEVLSHFDNLEY